MLRFLVSYARNVGAANTFIRFVTVFRLAAQLKAPTSWHIIHLRLWAALQRSLRLRILALKILLLPIASRPAPSATVWIQQRWIVDDGMVLFR